MWVVTVNCFLPQYAMNVTGSSQLHVPDGRKTPRVKCKRTIYICDQQWVIQDLRYIHTALFVKRMWLYKLSFYCWSMKWISNTKPTMVIWVQYWYKFCSFKGWRWDIKLYLSLTCNMPAFRWNVLALKEMSFMKWGERGCKPYPQRTSYWTDNCTDYDPKLCRKIN